MTAAAELDLFGNPAPAAAPPRKKKGRKLTTDVELAQAVIRRAANGSGYVLAGVGERVCRVAERDGGLIESVPQHEAAAVEDLLASGWFTIGAQGLYRWRNRREGSGRSVLVSRKARDALNRWAHLKGKPYRPSEVVHVARHGSETANKARLTKSVVAFCGLRIHRDDPNTSLEGAPTCPDCMRAAGWTYDKGQHDPSLGRKIH